MKRIILSVIMIISVVASFAQLYAVGQYAEVSLSGDVNHIYLFGSIDDESCVRPPQGEWPPAVDMT